jgi:hypothetical protein
MSTRAVVGRPDPPRILHGDLDMARFEVTKYGDLVEVEAEHRISGFELFRIWDFEIRIWLRMPRY